MPITLKFASGREVNTCVISHVIKELNNHRFCKPHVRPAWRKLNVMGCCPTSRSTKFVPMSSCGKRSTTCCLPRSTECTLKRQTKNCQRAKVPWEQNKLPITATCGRRLIKTFTSLPRNKLTKEIQTFQQQTPQLAPTQC